MTHGTLQLCDLEFLKRSSSVPCCRWICHPCWSLTEAAFSGDWNGHVTQCLLDAAGEFIPATNLQSDQILINLIAWLHLSAVC